jgi:predicted AlkP superfamily pyrophosphatase or phosphodiesterase
MTAEGLGADDVPDYLSVSFSGVDAVNHFFGPSSLENEEVVLELDRTLADFLAFVDRSVGLDETLVVLSADHGMPEAPEVLAQKGMKVGRLDPEKIVEVANDVAKRQFGLEGAVRAFFRPYLYLDSKAISAKGLDREQVEQVLAAALRRVSGIGKAVSMQALSKLSGTPVLDMIRKNYHPLRSGDIYLAQAPYWFLQEGGALAVMHGSPWRYDTHVPIIFAGAGIRVQTVHRHVRPVDVAPTIAKLLGIKEPSSASGTVLVEALQ